MKGFIANTDPDWYEFMLAKSRREELDEVNFWAPSVEVHR